MLETIKFIKEHENWKDILKQPPYCFTINEDEDYAILKYSQLDSDFTLQICKECRGLVIDLHTLEPVALSFIKFFNVQEQLADRIYWKDCKVLEKVDGSKMLCWFNKYKNKWQVSTSSQLDAYNANVQDFGITFGQLFDRAQTNFVLPNEASLFEYLDPKYCYTFELVSPESRVVIPYKKTDLYFIGVRDTETFEELDPATFELYNYMKKPKVYQLPNLKSCLTTVEQFGFDQEGFVVVDKHWNRVKIKSPAYLQAHYLRGNGVNSQSKILEIIEQNEQEEFLSYFPEYKDYFKDIEEKYYSYKRKIRVAIDNVKSLVSTYNRKEIAEFIKTNYSDISSFLFSFMDTDLIKLFIDTQWSNLPKDSKMKKLGLKYVAVEDTKK